MKPPAHRDEAFYVVNKTIAAMRTELNKALAKGNGIRHGAFNHVMNKVIERAISEQERREKTTKALMLRQPH
jgi:hypothetical protein